MGAGMTGEVETGQVRVFRDRDGLIREAAELFVSTAREAITANGVFRVALSGGNTPRPLYEALAAAPYREQVDWSKIQVFFSDERFVPADSPESNYRMASEALLSRVPIPERFVHRVPTEDIPPEEAASLYEEGIRRVFAVGLDETPSFDLILLGLGGDGHTASLFPDTEALTVTNRLVAPNFVPKLDTWRITFTYPLLNAGRVVTFLVQGEDKAERVGEILAGGSNLPAAGVRPESGRLVWLLDQAAAGKVHGLPVSDAPLGTGGSSHER